MNQLAPQEVGGMTPGQEAFITIFAGAACLVCLAAIRQHRGECGCQALIIVCAVWYGFICLLVCLGKFIWGAP